jgi:hypothetical protein
MVSGISERLLPLEDENNAWCTAFFYVLPFFLSRIVLFLVRA